MKNEKIYTGFTEKDPQQRLKEHNSGTNDWTRSNGPFMLVYYESYCCEKDARKREKFYKSGVGRKMRNLIIKTFEEKKDS